MSTVGFWGLPTSSVDWCEANYAFTPYVAEWFNTLSSVAMVAAGLMGLLLHRHLPLRFRVAFAGVALVGVGSAAFHATLRFELQMLDELPMLYLVLWIIHLLLESWPKPAQRRVFAGALLVYALVATYLCVLTRGPVQFWVFQLGFGAWELAALCGVYWLQRGRQDVQQLYRWGMIAYALAGLAWFTDLNFCRLFIVTLPAHGVPNPQLHAWWHLLVSCGFYCLLQVVAKTAGARGSVKADSFVR